MYNKCVYNIVDSIDDIDLNRVTSAINNNTKSN